MQNSTMPYNPHNNNQANFNCSDEVYFGIKGSTLWRLVLDNEASIFLQVIGNFNFISLFMVLPSLSSQPHDNPPSHLPFTPYRWCPPSSKFLRLSQPPLNIAYCMSLHQPPPKQSSVLILPSSSTYMLSSLQSPTYPISNSSLFSVMLENCR